MKNTFIIFLTTNLSGNVWQTLFTHFRGHFFWKTSSRWFSVKTWSFFFSFLQSDLENVKWFTRKDLFKFTRKKGINLILFVQIRQFLDINDCWLWSFSFSPLPDNCCVWSGNPEWVFFRPSYKDVPMFIRWTLRGLVWFVCVCVFFMIEKCHKPRKFQASLTSTFSIF